MFANTAALDVVVCVYTKHETIASFHEVIREAIHDRLELSLAFLS